MVAVGLHGDARIGYISLSRARRHLEDPGKSVNQLAKSVPRMDVQTLFRQFEREARMLGVETIERIR